MRLNRFREAFKENANMVGLATAAAASLALLNPLPLLAGVVLEAAYLLFIPDSKWYEKRISTRHDAEVEARRKEVKAQILPTLRPDLQERFLRMEATRRQIEVQAEPNKLWFREVVRKLDYLLEKYLQIASKEGQFRQYLQSLSAELRKSSGGFPSSTFDLETRRDRERRRDGRQPVGNPPTASVGSGDRWIEQKVAEIQEFYGKELEHITELIEKNSDYDTQAVLEKRKEVLTRRQEFAGKMERILTNTSHQLQLLEDTFGLINDEIRARNPEQLLSDIEEVVITTDTMASTLEELAPYEQLTGLSLT